MKKFYLCTAFSVSFILSQAQSVGINAGGAAPNPTAMLHVDGGTDSSKGFLVTGRYHAAAKLPSLGGGSRLMFYPGKAALRAGYVNSNQWDNENIGEYSVALGQSTKASGEASVALGYATTAAAAGATASGYGATASGPYSTAFGYFPTAGGSYSITMGIASESSADYATTIGPFSKATGGYATALGYGATASGTAAVAQGTFTIASGNYSTALGYGSSTNSRTGSFAIGDASGNPVSSTADNQMMMQFSGGYVLKGGAVSVDGDLQANNGLYLPSGGGTASVLNHYEETTASVKFANGAFTYLANYTVKFLRVGKQVTLTFPTDQLGLTAVNVDDMIMGTIPPRFRPASNIYLPLRIRNNGVNGMGLLWIRTDGQAWLKAADTSNGWTGNGNSGFYATSLTYSVQ